MMAKEEKKAGKLVMAPNLHLAGRCMQESREPYPSGSQTITMYHRTIAINHHPVPRDILQASELEYGCRM